MTVCCVSLVTILYRWISKRKKQKKKTEEEEKREKKKKEKHSAIKGGKEWSAYPCAVFTASYWKF